MFAKFCFEIYARAVISKLSSSTFGNRKNFECPSTILAINIGTFESNNKLDIKLLLLSSTKPLQ